MNDIPCNFDFTSQASLQALFASQIDIQSGGKSRICPSVPDKLFINTCFNRVISQHSSGREYIQKLDEIDEIYIPSSTFYDTLHSQRRLDLITNVSLLNYELLSKQLIDENIDYLNEFKELEGYEIFSIDGHYIEHSSHTERNDKGKVYAAGNLFALNLRNGLIRHFACVSDGTSKKHEMPVFRKNIENFICGKKTIFVADRAFLDYSFWEKQTRKKTRRYFKN